MSTTNPMRSCSTKSWSSIFFLNGRFQGLEHRLQDGDLAEAGVAGSGDPGDRIERFGLDLSIVQKTVAEVEHQDFADDQPAAGLAEFEALPEPALHRDRRCGEPRHRDQL